MLDGDIAQKPLFLVLGSIPRGRNRHFRLSHYHSKRDCNTTQNSCRRKRIKTKGNVSFIVFDDLNSHVDSCTGRDFFLSSFFYKNYV